MGEGLPTALIEAAACGRAIVATDVPGCRDVVVDGVTGLLVPPSQPHALAQALARLAVDVDLRRSMGAAGRALAVERFRSEKIHAQTWQVYQQVLGCLP
jgi:glycosyltransferase involved in cell wall biosynthesis